jgi:predicted ATPase/DNA-binding XRE family transcriptional regulator
MYSSDVSPTFGDLLKQLRKRAGMSQSDLAAATGYSRSLVGALEQNQRLPDVETVAHTYVPALSLLEEPILATQLVAAAAAARGERLSPAFRPPSYHGSTTITTEAAGPPRLPLPPTELIGRNDEVEQLCRRLQGHRGRLLTLVGPPGVGKTRLAQAVGAKLQWIYRHGACFVPLAAVNQPDLLVSTLMTTWKLQEGSSKPPATRVIEYLRHKEMLLILDNFEQIVAAAPLVAELLAECGDLHLVVTSRERLHLRAEQRQLVQPLALEAAVDLFCARAAAVEPGFALTPWNRPTLAAICVRLDRLPLALELCAAQADLLTLEQLLAHLQEGPLNVLVDGAQDLPPRQRTLRGAIRYSYELLDEDERRLLRSIGVLAGGGDLAAITAVSNWDQKPAARPLLATVHALVAKNLVQAEATANGARRFVLLETIREFAMEQLRAQGEEETLCRRHFATYLQFAQSADLQLRGPEAPGWFARFDAEQDNLRAAMQWALDRGRHTDAAWLVLVASWYWLSCGLRAEGAGWLARLLPHRRALEDDLRLAILLWGYAFGVSDEPFAQGNQYADEVITLLESCRDMLLRAAAWHWLASGMPDAEAANEAYERAIALSRAAYELHGLRTTWGLLGDRDFILAANIINYAKHLVDRGEVERAAPLAAESLELFQRRGDHNGISDTFAVSGQLALMRGDLDAAHTWLCHSKSIITTFERLSWRLHWQPLLGLVTLYRGDASGARTLLADSLSLCAALKPNLSAARICTYLADTALWDSKLDEAEQWLGQSLEWYAEPYRISIYDAERIFVAARLATAKGQYRRAAELFGLAEQAHDRVHHVRLGPQQALAEIALKAVRQALEPLEFATAFAAGKQLSMAVLSTRLVSD